MNLKGVPCEIRIACDALPSVAERARERGIPAFTTDPNEVTGRANVDIVLVLSAMQSHGSLTPAALLAGKQLLVGKEMAMVLAEAAELVELAKTSKDHLVCAPHVTLSRTYQQMWRRIAAGDIGRIHSARGMYGWSGPDWTTWFYETGGGPMFDLGVHNVTTLTGLIGPAICAATTMGSRSRRSSWNPQDRKRRWWQDWAINRWWPFSGNGWPSARATGFA